MTGTLISRLVARYRARRRYFAAALEATRVWPAFTDPAGTVVSRWEALSWAADCDRTMAATAFGFGDTYDKDFHGRTLEQAHRLMAELQELMADTELAPVPTDCGSPAWRWRSHLADDPAVSSVLTRLACETDMARRAELTVALHDAVAPMVGAQIAETLSWVARGYRVLAGTEGDDR